MDFNNDILIKAFKNGNKEEFFANLDKAEHYYEVNGKIFSFFYALTDIYSWETKEGEVQNTQLEILKALINEKDKNGKYKYDINDFVRFGKGAYKNNFKPIDLALIHNKGKLALYMLTRPDIDLQKPVNVVRKNLEYEEYPIYYAFAFCPEVGAYMVNKGLVDIDSPAFKGFGSINTKQLVEKYTEDIRKNNDELVR